MSEDARFEDGAERPLNLAAMDAEDLQVISSLVQDAVFPASEMSWQPRKHRFALLINRFRWEDESPARARGRPFERVQSLLVIENVQKVASTGIDRKAAELVYSLLAVEFQPGAEPAGEIALTLAGDGAIRLGVEALEMRLRDVTRPYQAVSGRAPGHGE